jgi:hypothetical protein
LVQLRDAFPFKTLTLVPYKNSLRNLICFSLMYWEVSGIMYKIKSKSLIILKIENSYMALVKLSGISSWVSVFPRVIFDSAVLPVAELSDFF